MKTLTITFSILFLSLISFSQVIVPKHVPYEPEIPAKITGVTIYTSSAEIHYENTVSLKKGKNTIVFTDLTPFIVENSINVSIADNSVNIITVTDKINYLKKVYYKNSIGLRDSILKNEDKLGLIDVKIETLEKEKSLLFRGESIGGVSEGVAVSEIEKASEFFNRRYSKINEELYYLNRQKTKLLNANENFNLQINEVSTTKGKSTSEIIVVANSISSKKVKVEYKLLTANAGWAPLYDLKFNGPDKDLDFVFRANVFNASKIDWNDVEIKLSTANPTTGFNLPSLNKTDNAQKQNLQYENQNIEFKTIQTNNIIAEYNIKFKYSIPSDGKPYLVDVSETSMKSSFSYIIIPKMDNNGFLMANIPDWNKYNLISGTTSIYNHGTYMGKTFLNTLTDNDTLDVYLGKDNTILTYRKEVNIDNPRIIVGNTFVDKTIVDITIKNNYDKNISIVLIDQVPVFDARDKVKMNITGIENALYNQSDGSLNWQFSLNPKESKEMRFTYTIKAPKELAENVRMKKRRIREISCPAF